LLVVFAAMIQRRKTSDNRASTLEGPAKGIANSHAGADARDCLSMLVESRCRVLQGVPRRKLKELSENAVAIVYGEDKRSMNDVKLWERLHVICEGEAVVRVHTGKEGWSTVAVLRRGDCFGAPSNAPSIPVAPTSPPRSRSRSVPVSPSSTCSPLDPSSPSNRGKLMTADEKITWTWRIDCCTPRVKAFRLPGDPALECADDLFSNDGHPVTNFAVHDVNTLRLLYLWTGASSTAKGLVDTKGLVRELFPMLIWRPLVSDLNDMISEIRSRVGSPAERFFLSGDQINGLKDCVMRTTERWYGQERGGNLSAFYRWFIDAMTASGVLRYQYEEILPRVVSKDGWLSMVDLAKKKAVLSSKPQQQSSVWGVPQKQGESAIDNTILCNVFTREEYVNMCRRHVLRKCLIQLLAVLHRIRLRSKWCANKAKKNGKLGQMNSIDDPSVRRSVAARFHLHLDEDGLKRVQGAEDALLDEQKLITPRVNDSCLFERFVAWHRNFPNKYFESDKLPLDEARQRHMLIYVAGLFSGHLAVLTRSSMERVTYARFFPFQWYRRNQLWFVKDGRQTVVRTEGVHEISRIRVNELPYVAYQGMSLSKGAAHEDVSPQDIRQRLAVRGRFGPTTLQQLQWIRDPSACVANWDLTDVEKILHESWVLNPRAEVTSELLPTEGFFSVGQNPNVSSSIRPTQHTHIAEAAYTSSWMARFEGGEAWGKDGLEASVEIVSCAEPGSLGCSDSLFFRAVYVAPKVTDVASLYLADPAASIVKLMVDLRLHLLTYFGGSAHIDFICRSFGGSKDGRFTSLLVPIVQAVRSGDRVVNPLTGETGGHWPVYGLGFGHVTGEVQTEGEWLDELRALGEQEGGGEKEVRRMLVFNRLPGLRQAMRHFLIAQGFQSAVAEAEGQAEVEETVRGKAEKQQLLVGSKAEKKEPKGGDCGGGCMMLLLPLHRRWRWWRPSPPARWCSVQGA